MRLEIQPIHDRPIKCGAHRRRHPKSKAGRSVTCEKPALHGFGCLLSNKEMADIERSTDPRGYARMLRLDAQRHAGRNGQGSWYFWEAS